MKNKSIKFATVLIAVAMAQFGCIGAQSQTENQRVQMADEKPKKSTPTTEAKLAGVVYEELFGAFTKVSTRSNYFGAFFVEATPQSVGYLQTLFTNSSPRVECGTNNVIFKGGRIIDKATQKPAVLFWARIESVSDKAADVKAGWHSSSESGAEFRFYLTFDGVNWSVTRRKQERIW
jgi:hypothetical protein